MYRIFPQFPFKRILKLILIKKPCKMEKNSFAGLKKLTSALFKYTAEKGSHFIP